MQTGRSIRTEKHSTVSDSEIYAAKSAVLLNITGDKKNWGAASEVLVTICKSAYTFKTTMVDDMNEIWVYQDGIYLPNGKSTIKEFSRIVLDQFYTEYLVNLAINKIQADTFINQDIFFNSNIKDEIAVKNGILNLTTKILSPFTKEKIFFNKINAEYTPGIKCEKIDKFLNEVLPDPSDVKTIYEMFGYTLYKDNFIERAFMMLGSGRNGKSKCLTILKNFLTVENITAMPLQKLENGDFKECALMNKLANIAGDISGYPLKENSKFKALTGRDIISAGRKFKNDVTFTNYAKLIFSTNHLPKTYDLDNGFFDRWVYLVFPFTFKEKKEYDELMKNLPDDQKKNYKLMDEHRIDGIMDDVEMSGLLNEALAGLDRLIESGSFTSSKTGEQTKTFWIQNSDSFLAFAMDNLEIDSEGIITKGDLRKRYQKYCKVNKIISEGDKHIKEVLVRQYTAGEERKGSSSYDQVWAWVGIKFKGPLAKYNNEVVA